MSNEPIFIGSPTDIATGELALKRLSEMNDSAYETEDGVTSVSLERWHKAQEYERATWIDQNQGSIDDRSNDHRIGFADYAALPKHLGNVIEFGCGAFTQVRNILTDHTADSIVLVDPLARVYQEKHQHCSYKNNVLDGKSVTVVATSVETFETDYPFDTVIFINVLSHCYDARKVLDVVWRSLKLGGTLVFQERIEQRGANLRYDVGHPLTVRKNVLDGFLARFEGIVETAEGYWIATKKAAQEASLEDRIIAGIDTNVRNPEPVTFVVDDDGEAHKVIDDIGEPVTMVIHQDTWDKLTEVVTLPVEPAAIEPLADFVPEQENGDDTAVSNIESPKKRGRKKKAE